MPSSSRKNKTSSKRSVSNLWPPAGLSRTIVLAILVLASTLGAYYVSNGSAAQTQLQSGIGGNGGGGSQCIDQNGGIYACNGSAGEKWGGIDSAGRIHVGTVCLAQSGANTTVGVGSSAQGRAVVGVACGSSAPWGGAWTWSGHTLRNNHANSKGGSYCLDVKGAVANGPLETYTCNGGSNQNWFVGTYGASSGGGGGTSVGSAIVAVAASQLGVHEDPNGCQCGIYVNQYTQGVHEEWCNDFVQWVYFKAGYGLGSRSSYVRIGPCSTLASWFASHHSYWSNNSTNRSAHTPQAGDFIDIRGGEHCAIVDHTSGGTVYTIDGNVSNSVGRRSYTLSDTSQVTGWGRW